MAEGALPPHHVTGSPGPEEAAAIAAAIEYLLAEEAARALRSHEAAQPSDWVLAARPRSFHAPLPSHVYDAIGGWGTAGEDGDDHPRP